MTHTDESHSARTNFEDVGDFHTKFGLPTSFKPGPPPSYDGDLLEFRRKFLLEEYEEFCEAIDEGDDAKAFDALLDLTYVAMGTAHLLGYPWQEGWQRVQAANMSKVRARNDGSDSVRGSAFDVVKPPGFIPPDIEELLRDYGW